MFDAVRLEIINTGLQAIAGELAWAFTELRSLPASAPAALIAEIHGLAKKLSDTLRYDVRTEVLNLRDKLGRGTPGEPYDPGIVNPDPFATTTMIVNWLAEDVRSFATLIERLRAESPQVDQVQMLLMAFMTNVLTAFSSIQDELQPILEAGPNGYLQLKWQGA